MARAIDSDDLSISEGKQTLETKEEGKEERDKEGEEGQCVTIESSCS